MTPRKLSRCLLAVLLLVGTLHAADPDPFDQSSVPIEELPKDPKAVKIVLIAGVGSTKLKSGEHEYFAGCTVLAKMLKQTPGVFPVIARDGWPKKPETLAGAKAVVLFLEGGTAHAALKEDRMQQLQKLADSGVGIVCLHSAIDYPNDFGERVRSMSGAMWEKGYSKRAHWVTEFKSFPDHAVTRGVTPFKIDDGWLYQLRFVADMKGVTPLLGTVSPKEKGKTSDPKAIISWVYERSGGGRSFNFTGCHLHESWALDGYRKLIVNGILWSANQEIPKDGAPVVLAPDDLKKYLERKPVPKK